MHLILHLCDSTRGDSQKTSDGGVVIRANDSHPSLYGCANLLTPSGNLIRDRDMDAVWRLPAASPRIR